MMIKLTTKCSMGCNHCISNCTKDGIDMDFETFQRVLDFQKELNLPIDMLIISGGEPTEHENFIQFIGYLLTRMQQDLKDLIVLVTTNGLWISEHMDFVNEIYKNVGKRFSFQIVVDDRYYPIHVDEEKLKHPSIMVCNGVSSIYPQGRALTNKLPSNRISPQCFNVRAISKQLTNPTLRDVVLNQLSNGHHCTPHIDTDGSIKLGESSLCPPCSSIYKSMDEIQDNIISFKCHQCDFLTDKLGDVYKKFVQ